MSRRETEFGQTVVRGRDALDALPLECERLGARRVLVVAGSGVQDAGVRVRELLAPICVGLFSDVLVNVPARQANMAVATAQETHADAVLTLGGGSAIGLGKIVALALRLPLLAVPTTYSGSEMTSLYGVLTDNGVETGWSERALPRVVIYDPLLSSKLPVAIIAGSGFDAIAACVETLWYPGVPGQPRAWAANGLGLLWEAVPRLVRTPGDLPLQECALEGAGFGGRALQAIGPGLYRRLCWALAGRIGVGPAVVSGALFFPVLDYLTRDRAAAAEAPRDISLPSSGALMDLARHLGLPTDPTEVGIRHQDLLEAASVVAHNPPSSAVPVSLERLARVLTRACG